MDKIPKYKELLQDDMEKYYSYTKLLEEKPLIVEKTIALLDKKQMEESLIDLNKEKVVSQNKRLKF